MGAVLLQHWQISSVELLLFIAGGFALLALAVSDCFKNRDCDSLLLGAWVAGTFFFTAFVNWSINARSILPLIPATGILIARRLEWAVVNRRSVQIAIGSVITAAAVLSFWVASGDVSLANSAKHAATLFSDQIRNKTGGELWFEGHWGFEYYMQKLGFQPFDFAKRTLNPGDVLIIPDNAAETTPLPAEYIESTQVVLIPLDQHVITESWRLGAGFYGSYFGPLPFAFSTVRNEKYVVEHIGKTMYPDDWGLGINPSLSRPDR